VLLCPQALREQWRSEASKHLVAVRVSDGSGVDIDDTHQEGNKDGRGDQDGGDDSDDDSSDSNEDNDSCSDGANETSREGAVLFRVAVYPGLKAAREKASPESLAMLSPGYLSRCVCARLSLDPRTLDTQTCKLMECLDWCVYCFWVRACVFGASADLTLSSPTTKASRGTPTAPSPSSSGAAAPPRAKAAALPTGSSPAR
jgi:hypothetical protein